MNKIIFTIEIFEITKLQMQKNQQSIHVEVAGYGCGRLTLHVARVCECSCVHILV